MENAMRPRKLRLAAVPLAVASTLALSGCLVGTAIDIAAETVEAGVEITGAVAGAAVDVVVPGDGKDDDEEKDKKKKKKDMDED
jgi:hypothetical protein